MASGAAGEYEKTGGQEASCFSCILFLLRAGVSKVYVGGCSRFRIFKHGKAPSPTC